MVHGTRRRPVGDRARRRAGATALVTAGLAFATPAAAGVATPVPLSCTGESGATAAVFYEDFEGTSVVIDDFGDCLTDTLWASEDFRDDEGDVTGGASVEVESDGFALDAQAQADVIAPEGEIVSAVATSSAWARFDVGPDPGLLEVHLDVTRAGGTASAWIRTRDHEPVWWNLPVPEGPSSHSVPIEPGAYVLFLDVSAGVVTTGDASARIVASIGIPEPGAPWLVAVGAVCLGVATRARRRGRRVRPV